MREGGKINIEYEMGLILTKFKGVEYVLDCIIANFVSAKRYEFFERAILNSGVMSTGSKLKVVRTIYTIKGLKEKGHNFDKLFNKLHDLLFIRNLFAHENYYQEASTENISGSLLITIEVFMKNGTFDIVRVEDKINEFNDLHKEVYEEVKKLNAELSKIGD